MKALITGGGGFLGRYVARLFKKHGYDVTVLGRRDYPFLNSEGIPTIKADILNEDNLVKSLKDFDEVHHIAALTGIGGFEDSFYKVNVIGTKNIISACIKNNIRKLIYTSSPSVVYKTGNQVMADESTPYPDKFLNFYSKTKKQAEQIVLEANDPQKLLTISLRPHLLWGPHDTNLLPRVLERAKKHKLFIVGKGDNMADLTYVENAAYAHFLASKKLSENSDLGGKAYFITNDEPVNLWAFINKILQGYGLKTIKRKLPYSIAYKAGSLTEKTYSFLRIHKEPLMTRFLADQLAFTHTYSIENAKKDLGYVPQISVDEGLKRLLSYLNNQKNTLY